VDREEKRQKETKSASGETEYWRQRGASFNTLYQQLNMPHVKRIIEVLKTYQESNQEKNGDHSSLENFKT
jgi:hypothetical protein